LFWGPLKTVKSEEQSWLQDCAQRLTLDGQRWIHRGMHRPEGFQRILFHWRTSSLVLECRRGLHCPVCGCLLVNLEHFDTFALLCYY
jgi:hypothetical protein